MNGHKQEPIWSREVRERETEAENCKRGEELIGSEKTESGKEGSRGDDWL